MATYKLEETQNTFISPYPDNRFVYRMMQFNAETSSRFIRDIDLRKDKLMIHGTEMKESMFHKLHDRLRLRQSLGKIYVNCNGACYIYVFGKGTYRPIDNVLFDWSPFGVIVPNSVSDSLQKRLQHKEEELAALRTLLSSTKNEAAARNASFEAAKQEIMQLKDQLSSTRKDRQDMEMELQKVRKQLSSKEFELDSKNIEFESSKKEVEALLDQVSVCKKDNQTLETDLQRVKDQLSEQNCTLSLLEQSKERVAEVEKELCCSKKESQDLTLKLQHKHDKISLIESELESSNKKLRELEFQVSSFKKENEDIVTELQEVKSALSCADLELQNLKNQVESSHKEIDQLEKQVSKCKNEIKAKEMELQKVHDQLSFAMNELQQSTKILFEFTEKEHEKPKDQSFSQCHVIRKIDIVEE